MNNEFEKWIRESAPVVEVDEHHKEMHLAVLKNRLRDRDKLHMKRQKQTRRASVVVAALMFVMIGGNVSELGSDGFDFVVSENEFNSETKSMEIGFRKLSISGSVGDSDELLRDLAVQMEMGDGIPASVGAIEIKGHVWWDIRFDYNVRGGMHPGGRTVRDRPSSPTLAHLEFAETEMKQIDERIENGSLSAVSSRIETVEGYRFLIKEYHIQSDQFGLIVWKKGTPIR